jgi:hypothetical protein
VLGWGIGIGALFASILGALSITAEFRHGAIRPTLLATPKRPRVIAAKLLASVLAGLAIGLLAEGFTAALETAGLAARGIHISLGSPRRSCIQARRTATARARDLGQPRARGPAARPAIRPFGVSAGSHHAEAGGGGGSVVVAVPQDAGAGLERLGVAAVGGAGDGRAGAGHHAEAGAGLRTRL